MATSRISCRVRSLSRCLSGAPAGREVWVIAVLPLGRHTKAGTLSSLPSRTGRFLRQTGNAETLQRLRADIVMLLVEQNAMLTFAATSHCLVLENGEIALTGPSAELRTNPRIRRLYLGLLPAL